MKRVCIGLALSVAAVLGGCTSSPPGGTTPITQSGDPAVGPVTVQRSTFQVRFRLEGVTRGSTFVDVLPHNQLSLKAIFDDGDAVRAGQVIGDAIVDPVVRAELERDGINDLDRSRLAQLETMTGPVEAPVDGLFSERDGRPVVLADGIDVVVPLTAIQYLRYQSLVFTGTATVETVVGVRQVPCRALWTEVVPAEDASLAASLHCRLPRTVETAPSLRSRVTIETQPVSDVIVVPNVFVGYDANEDSYYVILRNGETDQRVPVIVGATDGVRRIILSDLPIGAELVRPPEGSSGD